MSAAGIVVLVVVSAVASLPMTPAHGASKNVTYESGTRAPVVVGAMAPGWSERDPVTAAREGLVRQRALYRIGISGLRVINVSSFGDVTTVRFQQMLNGIPVFGATYLVHLRHVASGYKTISSTGRFYTQLSTSTSPVIDVRAAERIAWLSQRPMQVQDATTHGLVVMPQGHGVLAYRVAVTGTSFGHLVRRDVYVGARSGGVIAAVDSLESASPVVGTGTTAHGDVVPLNLVATASGFEMRDETKSSFDRQTHKGQIDTYDLEGSGLYIPTKDTLVRSSTPTLPSTDTDSGAVDAHYNAGKVYDYYERLTGLLTRSSGDVPTWDSIDGRGGSIKLLVNASDRGSPLFNAFWDGHEMVFGNPDPVHLYPLSAALDVVGHELTHGITQHTANLVYMNESGAMNEAYSDYFGNAIQDDFTGTDLGDPSASYFGETLCKQPPPPPSEWSCPLRDVADGRTTSDYGRLLEDVDLGGVHLNSTIFSGALWDVRRRLFAADGAAGADRADAYAYLTLTQFELPTDSFFDGRVRVLQAQ
ncbi:MAG: M4 family metallopeptidase, partial [Actinomycetota bacterium]|nr:M4 family metallopeptidase [Actinomycetota bacterium]